jgi:hypothetical protein
MAQDSKTGMHQGFHVVWMRTSVPRRHAPVLQMPAEGEIAFQLSYDNIGLMEFVSNSRE